MLFRAYYQCEKKQISWFLPSYKLHARNEVHYSIRSFTLKLFLTTQTPKKAFTRGLNLKFFSNLLTTYCSKLLHFFINLFLSLSLSSMPHLSLSLSWIKKPKPKGKWSVVDASWRLSHYHFFPGVLSYSNWFAIDTSLFFNWSVVGLWFVVVGDWIVGFVGCGLLGFEGCFIGSSWVVVDGGRGFLWLVVLQGYGGGIVWWCMRERQREG